MSFNLDKYKREWGFFADAWESGDDTATHRGGKLTNRFVEACRASPYIAGHLLMLVVGLCVIGWLL